ncbi:MAG: glycosyltransferase family 1 protein [Chloroflexi bacterium]|nr:glycosyltransferase family 1 protein [Chloroflexota bacterium]
MLIGIDASRAMTARRTGTETYSLNLIRALIGLGTEHRFRLYTNGAAHVPGISEMPGTSIRPIPFPRLWTHVRLSAEMMTRPPDVLFVPAHVLPLFHGRRSVVTVHDLGYLSFPAAHRTTDRLYLDWSTRWNAQQATAILADSAATKADLVRAYGADPAKVHVVYLGRDEALAPVADPVALAEVRERYGIAGRYLLYVGTLQPRKNLGRIIEAFARLIGAPPAPQHWGESLPQDWGSGGLQDWGAGGLQNWGAGGLQLVLAGKKGWLYDDLFVQVDRLGLAGRVLFPGYVADEHLPALLSGATAFVFPSLYEGFGIPVLEAGACGVPVITSNTSSLPEVAGDAALLVDPHDVDAIAAAMHRLVTDDALRAELARRGQENVKRFSWEKCARETLAVLEDVGRQSDKVTR